MIAPRPKFLGDDVGFDPVSRTHFLAAENLAHGARKGDSLVDAQNRRDILGDDPDVVSDEKDRHFVFPVEVAQKVVEPRQGSDIHTGGGLIENQYLWFGGDGPGNHDSLALASREFADEPVFKRVDIQNLHRLPYGFSILF